MTARQRVAAVTGASTGIGLAVASRLAGEGNAVVLCARRADVLDDACARLVDGGARAIAVALDVTAPGAGDELVARAVDEFGALDVLVNNAGGGPVVPFDRLTVDDWQEGLELNFLSAVRCCLAAVPEMARAGGGAVVNVVSSAAREPDPYFGPYGAAKAALMNYTKTLASAVAARGVRANCVLPGIVDTEGMRQVATDSAAATGRSVDDVMKAMLRRHPVPLGRLGTPEDVAALVGFLASSDASWITGATFTVDGGSLRGI